MRCLGSRTMNTQLSNLLKRAYAWADDVKAGKIKVRIYRMSEEGKQRIRAGNTERAKQRRS